MGDVIKFPKKQPGSLATEWNRLMATYEELERLKVEVWKEANPMKAGLLAWVYKDGAEDLIRRLKLLGD